MNRLFYFVNRITKREGNMRKDLLVEGEIYHIFSKSIANFIVFNNDLEFSRMLEAIHYYEIENPAIRFSDFIELHKDTGEYADKDKLVEIIAYCLMPTHLHLILKQLKEKGISVFMSTILNSYSRYFNLKHNRKGPLWESRFKNVLVETDEQLLHLTRYLHLNPVTAYLVNKPEEWTYSSYKEYLTANNNLKICNYCKFLDIKPVSYKIFIDDRISYQRELAEIKSLILE